MIQANSEILDRLPPQSLEAERAVLCSILLDQSVCEELALTLRPEDFYANANARLYRRMLAMHESGGRIDETLLVEELRHSGEFETVGGMAYLLEVANAVAVASHAMYYAEIVRAKSITRSVAHVATDTLRDCYDPTLTPEELLNKAQATITGISATSDRHEPVTLGVALQKALARIDAIAQKREEAGLMTGLTEFDRCFGGLFKGELIILAARTSVGKTSLACQIAEYAASRGRLVYFASLEMSAEELATKIVCGASTIDSRRLRTGKVTGDDVRNLVSASNGLPVDKLLIHDRARFTVQDIARSARRHVNNGLSLIVVDYLQRVTPVDRKLQRVEQIGSITDGLKAVARELNVPVLCLCQLNRAAEREDRPSLIHLRESGSIEQDADMVLFLYRKPSGSRVSNGEDKQAELIVEKHRMGDTGTVPLFWIPERTRYECQKPANHEAGFDEFGDF